MEELHSPAVNAAWRLDVARRFPHWDSSEPFNKIVKFVGTKKKRPHDEDIENRQMETRSQEIQSRWESTKRRKRTDRVRAASWLAVRRSSFPKTRDIVTDSFIAYCFQSAGPCYWCGLIKKITIDHVIPLNRGGKHHFSNMQASCGLCNSSKANLLPEEYAERLKFKGRPAPVYNATVKDSWAVGSKIDSVLS